MATCGYVGQLLCIFAHHDQHDTHVECRIKPSIQSAVPHPGAARVDAAKCRSLLADAAAHAAANGHPRLWRAVADAALGAGELKAAERAYVRCSDYNVSKASSNAHGNWPRKPVNACL